MTLREMLEELEWRYSATYSGIICPICERETHEPDCELAYWIKVCKTEQAILPWVDITPEDIEQERRDDEQ